MKNEEQKNPFRAAYDEAHSELQRVLRECEQLLLQRDRVEKVVRVLKPIAGLDAVADQDYETPANPPQGFTVLTHITVVRAPRKSN